VVKVYLNRLIAKPIVSSETLVAEASGVLITLIPLFLQASLSILSVPTPGRATTFNSGALLIILAVTFGFERTTKTCLS